MKKMATAFSAATLCVLPALNTLLAQDAPNILPNGDFADEMQGVEFWDPGKDDTDFDRGEDRGRDDVVAHSFGAAGVEPIDQLASCFDGDGCEGGAAGHVADCEDMGDGCLLVVVDCDESAWVELHASRVEAEVFDVGDASDGGDDGVKGGSEAFLSIRAAIA